MSTTTASVNRVLPDQPFETVDAYIASGGGEGLRSARLVEPTVVTAEIEASGLRGRGGAGFPTGTKWRTVLQYASAILETHVVVNAAEGEPGTYKDRTILLANPYAVLEGALIAAHVVGARGITIATKQRFGEVVTRVRAAIGEIERAGWSDGIAFTIVEGPGEYLYGEETALLEVLDGRAPLPRIAPPWRRGLVEVVEDESDLASGSGLAADVVMATPGDGGLAPPVLVDNVETLANVPAIVARGAAWFRELGTAQSPGTIVCTVTGAVQRAAVIEVPMGTTVRAVIEEAGGGMVRDATTGDAVQIRCVLMGVSNAVLGAEDLDLPLSYEGMRDHGTGLGSASIVVVDDQTDPVAVAAGVARFLAVESCGQCTACKQDGLEISHALDDMVNGQAGPDHLQTITHRLDTVVEGARCALATQQQVVIGSLVHRFAEAFSVRAAAVGSNVEPYLVAELDSIAGGRAVVDESFRTKQSDWTHDEIDSGQFPAERLGEHRA